MTAPSLLQGVVLLYCVIAVGLFAFAWKRDVPRDYFLIAFVAILVVLQFLFYAKTTDTETYVDLPVMDELENVADMPAGLVMYVTGFNRASYTSGKFLKNVAITDEYPTVADANKDMFFRVDPAFSKRYGFSMSSNSLIGPLSYQMGIKGDLAFTVAAVFQLTGITAGQVDVICLRLYANTPDNNGLCVYMNNFTQLSGNVVSLDMFVTFGSSPPMRCSVGSSGSSMLMDTSKRYMMVYSKGNGKLKVSLVDVGANTAYDLAVLLDAKLTSRESVVFSNREMMVNNNENWNANLMSLAVFDTFLADTEINALYTHYTGIFRKMDPAYKDLMDQMKSRDASRACPFDRATCAACMSVADFTDNKGVLASSDQCLSSIDAYCAANPGHGSCWCWDTQNPYYATRCKAYRALYSPVVDIQYNPDIPIVEPTTNNDMDELMKYVASDQITDGQGNASMVSSMIAKAKKGAVTVLENPAVRDATTSVDAVQAMLAALSDLKKSVPTPTPNAVAAANVAALSTGPPPVAVAPPATTSKFSFFKWLFGIK